MQKFFQTVFQVDISDPKQLIGQIFGLLAMCVAVSSFQMKTQRKIMFMQLISSSLFACNYFLIGAIAGSVMNIIAIIRAIIYSQQEKHDWANHYAWLILFIVLFICVYPLDFTLFGVERTTRNFIIESLPVIGSIFVSVSFRMKKASMVRLTYFCGSPLWLSYNFCVHNIGATFTELFCMISTVIGIVRLDIRSKEKGKEKQNLQ